MLRRLLGGGGQYIEEIEFVEDEAARDPRIKAIVPMAPLEWGARAEPILRRMRDHHPLVRGIRRIVEFDQDPRALTLSTTSSRASTCSAKFGWHFEINVNHTQMDIVREFVLRVPRCPYPRPLRKPAPGRRHRAVPRRRGLPRQASNLWIKLSTSPSRPISRTGPRTTCAPTSPLRSTPSARPHHLRRRLPDPAPGDDDPPWVDVLDRAFADSGLSESETRAIYRENSIASTA
jgi:L-fuconolactonase